MSFGLTEDGFNRKRLADIKLEIEERLRNLFGRSINLRAPSVWATIVGILAEREDTLWQLGEAVYNSQYPSTAVGVSLENVGQILGLEKQEAVKSTVEVHLFGTAGTIVPVGTLFSVDGNSVAVFETLDEVTLVAGDDEIQTIEFDLVPTTGSFKLVYEGEETALIPFSANAAAVEAALNALDSLSEVDVTGDFTSGFVVTFEGADGKIDHILLVASDNTLTDGVDDVVITISQTNAGEAQGIVSCEATELGAVEALSRTLIEIDTPVSGLNSVLNLEDATLGRLEETDLEFRERIQDSAAITGSATLRAIRAAVRDVRAVTSAKVYENDDLITDGDGRPPKSIEAVVEGGDDDDIAQAIWDKKAGGIKSHGNGASGTAIDEDGVSRTVNFSRPADVNIYVALTLTVDINIFPSDGVSQVKEAIVSRGTSQFQIGDDVIVIPQLLGAIDEIDGILDAEIAVGTAPSPTLEDNIPILGNQRADFDTSRVSVTLTS